MTMCPKSAVDGSLMSVSLVLLRCRTSDRTPGAGRGAETLAPLVGKALGIEPRVIGSAGEPRADGCTESGYGCIANSRREKV